MRYRRFALALALFPCFLSCNRRDGGSFAATGGDAVAVDLSTPKAAARTYADAMRVGDAESANRAVTGVDPRIIKLLADLGASRNGLEAAAVKRFGDEGKRVAGGSEAPYGPSFLKLLDQADVRIDGDHATITERPAIQSTTGPANAERSATPPLKLMKIGNDWKLDYGAMENTHNLTEALPLMEAFIHANREVAQEINSGTYSTPTDAIRGRVSKLREVIHPPGPSTLPATTPGEDVEKAKA